VNFILIELWVLGNYLEYLWDLEKMIDDDWHVVTKSLEAIWTILLVQKDTIVNFTIDDHTLTHAKSHVATLFDTLLDSRR
jgi:hypothetical protein